ncbi:MAG TPA: hypothetical protein VFZ61_00360 [Polyangiales bacterium]
MSKSETKLEPVKVEETEAGSRDDVLGPGSGAVFHDMESGRVTLSLDGPPLTLPDELPLHEVSLRKSSQPAPQYLDAWSVDRIRRSSLPPTAQVATFSSEPPAFPAEAPANDTQSAEELREDDLLALVGRARPAQSLDLVTEMTERFALGDYSGALRAAQLLLGKDPSHALGQHYARESQAKLEDMYTSKLSVQGGVFRVAIPTADIAWLGLDPQVSALLALVDGRSHYEALLAHCGMPRLWALRTLVELLEARVIRLV